MGRIISFYLKAFVTPFSKNKKGITFTQILLYYVYQEWFPASNIRTLKRKLNSENKESENPVNLNADSLSTSSLANLESSSGYGIVFLIIFLCLFFLVFNWVYCSFYFKHHLICQKKYLLLFHITVTYFNKILLYLSLEHITNLDK